MISQKDNTQNYFDKVLCFWIIVTILTTIIVSCIPNDPIITVISSFSVFVLGFVTTFVITARITSESKRELNLYKESLLEIRYFKGKNKVRILHKMKRYWEARALEVPLTYGNTHCVIRLRHTGMTFISESFNFWKERKETNHVRTTKN